MRTNKRIPFNRLCWKLSNNEQIKYSCGSGGKVAPSLKCLLFKHEVMNFNLHHTSKRQKCMLACSQCWEEKGRKISNTCLPESIASELTVQPETLSPKLLWRILELRTRCLFQVFTCIVCTYMHTCTRICAHTGVHACTSKHNGQPRLVPSQAEGL